MVDQPATFYSFVVLLSAAAITDLVRRRIPNILTLVAVVAGIALSAYHGGWVGALMGLAGLCTGLIALLPLYVKGGMAAGDVKLMAAVGTFLGPLTTLYAVLFTLVIGGVVGLGLLIVRGGLGDAGRRYLFGLRQFVTGGVWIYLRPAPGEAAATRFPYAVAIAAGSVAALSFPSILAFPGA